MWQFGVDLHVALEEYLWFTLTHRAQWLCWEKEWALGTHDPFKSDVRWPHCMHADVNLEQATSKSTGEYYASFHWDTLMLCRGPHEFRIKTAQAHIRDLGSGTEREARYAPDDPPVGSKPPAARWYTTAPDPPRPRPHSTIGTSGASYWHRFGGLVSYRYLSVNMHTDCYVLSFVWF